ncbi:MAG: ERCC4 domain-containing protein [Candidatus Limnocylindria bacterium]
MSGEGRIFLAARETWPRGRDVYCHQLAEWPPETELVEEVPVEACWRAGASVHLVLRRPRNRRSLFVWTRARGRPVIFWRSQASMRGARPGIRVPQARGLEGPLDIAIDRGERYPWRFAKRAATVERRGLPVGDYAVLRDGELVAVVERKTVADLTRAAVGGSLRFTLAELERVPHGALVVEGRLSDAMKAAERGAVRPGWLLNLVAALQVSHPRVAWMFAETRAIAEDWAYRWLSACVRAESQRYQIPLLDERAIADPTAQEAPSAGPRVLDAQARRSLLVAEAERGTEWTSRAAAERCRVTPQTATRDLKGLVGEGLLVAEGAGRSVRYRRRDRTREVH